MKRMVNAFMQTGLGKRASAVFMLCAAAAMAAQAQTFTTVFSFDVADGYFPQAALIEATNGELYGTTEGGGYGYGTVFKITPGGTLTTVYIFGSETGCPPTGCPDGELPTALAQAAGGDFYGTTYSGGANGGGTVFKITPSGTLTTLYSFCAQSGCPDGKNPHAGLVQATNGYLYTGQRILAGPTAVGRSSKSPRAAR
jgi:uncharacterized repeat protein (TIGR03803 family)